MVCLTLVSNSLLPIPAELVVGSLNLTKRALTAWKYAIRGAFSIAVGWGTARAKD